MSGRRKAEPRPSRGSISNARALHRTYARRAKHKNISFDISLDDFMKLTKKNCYICNASPAGRYRHDKTQPIPWVYNGLDRVDNFRGYTADNVIACCKTCNVAKASLPLEDFLLFIYNAFNHIVRPALKKPRKRKAV